MNTLNKKISNKNHGLVLEVSNYSYITGTPLSLSLPLSYTHTQTPSTGLQHPSFNHSQI